MGAVNDGRTVTAEPIGEIIQTSTTHFVAQCCELGQAPPFGSLVRVSCPPGAVFGLVYRIATGGVEPGSQAVMRGRSGVRDEAIYLENPDLRAVLRTDFAALIVGFREGNLIRQYLPPQPPPLHWSVYVCEAPEVVELSSTLDYFRTVLGAGEGPVDELLAAHVRQATAARRRDDRAAFRYRAGRELARLLSRDYERLTAILRRFAEESDQ